MGPTPHQSCRFPVSRRNWWREALPAVRILRALHTLLDSRLDRPTAAPPGPAGECTHVTHASDRRDDPQLPGERDIRSSRAAWTCIRLQASPAGLVCPCCAPDAESHASLILLDAAAPASTAAARDSTRNRQRSLSVVSGPAGTSCPWYRPTGRPPGSDGGAWARSAPPAGSHYDPRITAILILSAAATVTLIWGPQSLARNPRTRLAERNARPIF